MKLSLAMIVKGDKIEAQYLERALDSVRGAFDERIIVITHKKGEKRNKQVEKVARKHRCEIYDFEWVEDFSKARNFSFEKCTGDIIFWMDADDVISDPKKLREVAKAMPAWCDAIFLNYHYAHDESGAVTTEHWRERLIRNNGCYEWKGRLHETLIETRTANNQKSDEVYVIHTATENRGAAALERNMRILQEQLKDEGDEPDPRTVYYLARCFDESGLIGDAKELYETYVTFSGWAEERAKAFIALGRIEEKLENNPRAIDLYLQAIKEDPDNPEAYINIAYIYYLANNFQQALTWVEMGMARPDKESMTVHNPLMVTYRPLLIYAECQMNLGKFDEAINAIKKAQTYKDDQLVREMLDSVINIKGHQLAAQAILDLLRFMEKEGDTGKIAKFLDDCIPQSLVDNPIILGARKKYFPPIKWQDKSVVIFTGACAIGEWGPWSLSEGIGGSEEAIIRLSKHLLTQGYSVTVYSQPGARRGVYEGVDWRNYWELDARDEFDVLIGWRNPWFFDANLKARKRYLWLHDVMPEGEFTESRLNNLDKVMVLSDYHRSLFPNIPDNKIWISSNGIDTSEFDGSEDSVKEPHRIIYTSSHVRGLSHLYDIWPEVKKAVPDATLDIYYGWESYIAVQKDNPERMDWMEKMKARESELDGVTDHGKVSQEIIAQETMRAGVWAYPCPFPEISCHPAGTKVMTEYGEKNIEELEITDRVLTHTQSLKDVSVLMRRRHQGKIINLSLRSGDDIVLTPEHPVYVCRDGKYSFVPAEEIEIGDKLLTPGAIEIPLEKFIIDDGFKQRANNLPTKKNILPKELTTTPNLARFIGYFAGDGSASIKTGKVSVLVADKHPEHIPIALDGFLEFGLKPKTRQLRGCVEYYVQSYELARAFQRFCYDNKKKKLPLWLAQVPEVLEGLLAADGSVKNNYNYSFTNTSEYLIGWCKIALAQQGYSGKAQKRIHNNGGISWTIAWTQTQKVPAYTKVNGFIEKTIKNKTYDNYDGWVYNLEVEKDNSYVSNGSVVHNCITAMKCQAGGAIPVASDYAALKETIKYGVKMPMPEWNDETKEKYKNELIEMLRNVTKQKEIRKEMIPYAKKNLGWDKVAKAWDKEFSSVS